MYELTKIYKTKAMAVNAIRMTATNKGWKVLSTEDAAQHVWPQAEGFTVNNTSLNLALGFISEADADALEQRVPAGSVTNGEALEAVNAALCGATGNMVSDAVNIRADAWNDRIAAMPDDQVKTLFEQTGRRIPSIGNALSHMREALRQEHPDDLDNYTIAPKLQAPSKLEESKKAAKAAKKADKAPKGPGEEGRSATRCNVVNGARRPLRGKTLLVWEVTERLQAQLERVPTLKEVHEQLVSMEPGFNKTTAGIQYYACRAYNGWASDKK